MFIYFCEVYFQKSKSERFAIYYAIFIDFSSRLGPAYAYPTLLSFLSFKAIILSELKQFN